VSWHAQWKLYFRATAELLFIWPRIGALLIITVSRLLDGFTISNRS
jgi:hypothetical protein